MFSYRLILTVLLSWMVAVGLLFWMVPDKKIASVIAGIGFILIPLMILLSEYKNQKKNWLFIIYAVVFLACCALPIFLLRLTNWNSEFSSLSIFGIAADQIHKVSNGIYILMVVEASVAFWKERKLSK